MLSGDLLISADIVARLGDDGVAAVAARLWQVDCQSCGRPLGAGRTTLAVDQAGDCGQATVHHERCRPPQWNDSGIVAVDVAKQTHRSQLVMMPVDDGTAREGQEQSIAVMIVNPALECVQLRQAGGQWHPQLDEDFARAGMAWPGPGLAVDHPIPGAVARLTPAGAEVTFQARPGIVYQSGLSASGREAAPARNAITAQGGLLLAVSHVVDPAAASDLDHQFKDGLYSGQVLMGWVRLEVLPGVLGRLTQAAECG